MKEEDAQDAQQNKNDEFVSILIGQGFINEAIFYTDKKCLNEKFADLDKSNEFYSITKILFELLNAPILIDSIEELTTNYKRNVIRKIIHSIDHNLYHFYESNKLQSSNLVCILSAISLIVGDEEFLPEDIFIQYKNIRQELSGGDGEMGVHAYKATFNNTKKLEMVRKVESLAENFLEAFFRGEIN